MTVTTVGAQRSGHEVGPWSDGRRAGLEYIRGGRPDLEGRKNGFWSIVRTGGELGWHQPIFITAVIHELVSD